jgi:hypothetical protein
VEQRNLLQKELEIIRNFADGILAKWAQPANSEASAFLKNKQEELATRRTEMESGLASLEAMITEIEREAVTQELVTMALGKITGVFGALPRYQKKEMIRLVLHRAEISDSRLRLALHGRPPEHTALEEMAMPQSDSSSLSEAFAGLPVVGLERVHP